MQPVDEFIRELLLARIAEEKQILANRVGYRQRFFCSDCSWDSHAGTVEIIESEQIISIEKSESEALVITEHAISVFAPGARRLRYHLKAAGVSWLICDVERYCPLCLGQGDENCIFCKGRHWVNSRDRFLKT